LLILIFHRVLGKASTTPLSDEKLKGFVRLGQDEKLKITVDTSLKNRSSIAFIAEDGPTRILLLGDAIAEILKPLYKGTPVDFTLMKVGGQVFGVVMTCRDGAFRSCITGAITTTTGGALLNASLQKKPSQ